MESRADADPAGTLLPLGGPNLDRQGLRSSPSIRYLDALGPFEDLGIRSAKGGFFWDGRANSRAEQARSPLFNPNEMANPDVPAFAAHLRSAPYFAELLAAGSLDPSASDDDVLDAALQAIAAFQADDAELHSFSSKYDAYLDGRAELTAQEARGLRLFEDPAAGNCAKCHPSAPGPNGEKPLFTDFFYFPLGVPRNPAQRQNADPTFFDLGLCGPLRTDLASRSDLCGFFRTPTLRNVALTAPYFHNGVFETLHDVVSFYATRDTDPGRWYPTVGGVVQKFDDLPPAYRAGVVQFAPFGGSPGDPPRLGPQDVDDIVAFLGTLTDGTAP